MSTQFHFVKADGSKPGLRETLREAAAGARAVAGLARRLASKTLGGPLASLAVMRPRAEHLQPAVHGGDTAIPVEVCLICPSCQAVPILKREHCNCSARS